MLTGGNLKQTLRDTCQEAARGRRRSARTERIVAALGVVAALAACARTGLDPSDLDPFVDDGIATGGTGGSSSPPPLDASTAGMPPDARPDAPFEDGSTDPTVPPPDPNDPEPCVPEPESCNGRDDDCNGQVDELPGEPCAGGGFRYCVAGRMSECPRSCEVCVPGSVRICQNSYCTFWGEQECAADGQGFGPCREGRPPPRCDDIARQEHASPELEQCCIDDGYCCLDEHDLDHDGNRRDMLGACDGVRCP
ncbi:MAG TPA: hypothetical protein VMS65_10050 [Polyangiaceae bacterium]|nr:hypothetical protein [Polyangiaceae bacterium]